MSASPLRRREWLLAAVFLALWVLPPFWQIVTLQTVNVQDDIYTSDLLNDRLPSRVFLGESLRRGEAPFWSPGIYTGFPGLAEIEMAVLYPSNLLLFGALSPYAAIAWAQVLPLWIAGLGVFLLASEYGLPVASRLLAAGALSLSGFFVVHLRQLNLVDAAAWAPLLLLCVERLVHGGGGRAGIALAILWSIQLLAGHPQVSYFTGLVLCATLVVRWWQTRAVALSAAAGWFVFAIAVGTLVAGAQIVPSAELSRLTYREGGLSFEQSAAYAASQRSLLLFFFPYAYGDPGRDDFRLPGLFWEQYGYLGLVPALLAIAAVVVERRDPRVRFLAAMVAVSCLLVLGPNTPLYRIVFHAVPGMSYFRFPTRFLLFAELGIALLAGFGLRAAMRGLGERGGRVFAALAIAVTAGDLWAHQMRQVPQARFEEWTSPIGTERILAAERAKSDEAWRCYTLDSAQIHVDTFHKGRGWADGVAPYVWLRALLQPSSNLLFGLETPDGYANLVPRHYEAVWGSEKKPGVGIPSGTMDGESWRLRPELLTALRLFNVRYVLAVQPLAPDRLRLVARSPEGVGIHEVEDFLPRAFVVGEARIAGSDDEVLEAWKRPDFDPSRTAFVDDPSVRLPSEARSSRSVRIVARENERMVVEARLEAPGLLVVSEGYYPGWRATVDGEAAPIVRTNVMMRGVVLPAGRHEVRFEFRSGAIRAGFALSVLGLVVLALAARRVRS